MTETTHWLQLMLTASAENADQLGDLLSAAGALAVTLKDCADEPIYEPLPGDEPLWSQTRVIGLFPADAPVTDILDRLLDHLKKSPGLPQTPDCHIKRLENQDWERVWMDQFKPMRFGKRLWICPTGQTVPDADAVTITLDPGLAFGTGSHATTALCLTWLDQQCVTDKEMIDYGCGSGILAVTAAKLGARLIHAVDIDAQALYATRENARKNKLSNKIHTWLPDELPAQPVDCLLANILANPLLELAPRFAALTKTAAYLLLSGILSEQTAAVCDAYRRWFSIDDIQERDGWVAIAARRKQHD